MTCVMENYSKETRTLSSFFPGEADTDSLSKLPQEAGISLPIDEVSLFSIVNKHNAVSAYEHFSSP